MSYQKESSHQVLSVAPSPSLHLLVPEACLTPGGPEYPAHLPEPGPPGAIFPPPVSLGRTLRDRLGSAALTPKQRYQ